MQELLSGRVRVKVENGKVSFYKEIRFKDIEIGKIPEDWEVVRLGDKEIAEIRKNKSINSVDEVAFISMEHIPDSEIYAKF